MRRSRLILTAVAAAALLAGCGGSTPQQASTKAAASASVPATSASTPTPTVDPQPTPTVDPKKEAAKEYARIMELSRPAVNGWNKLVAAKSRSDKKWAKACKALSTAEAAQLQALTAYEWPKALDRNMAAMIDALARDRSYFRDCARQNSSNTFLDYNDNSGVADDVTAASTKIRLHLGLPLPD